MFRSLRSLRFWFFLGLIIAVAIPIKGYWNATRDPIIREAAILMPDWPADAPPIKVLLIGDTHVAGPDMPPARLKRILKDLNQLKPDLILLAGDYISEKRVATHIYTPAELAAPFALMDAPLGIIGVPGNHDHWAELDAIISEMEKNGVTMLTNDAVKRGALIIGGVDDEFTEHADLAKTITAMDALEEDEDKAPRIVVSHSPDIVPDLPGAVGVVVTGHTHCGQIVLPVIGALTYVSKYGARFRCGKIDDDGQKVVVTAGLGTSVLPLRYGAPPDVWLLELGSEAKEQPQ